MVAEKSLTEKNAYMYYIREKEGKNENLKKEDKMRISILISIYTVHFAILKTVTEISIGEKEKWTNKGTDKQYVGVLLLHNTTHH